MKKVFLLFSLLALLSSCKFHGSHNGDLDGFWMLTQVDTLLIEGNAVNGQEHIQTCRERRLFWSFQADIMKTQQLIDGQGMTIYLYRFCHEGNQLDVFEPHEYERMHGNVPIDAERLNEISRFGINSLEENYLVEKLNSKNMILKSESLRLYFEKY